MNSKALIIILFEIYYFFSLDVFIIIIFYNRFHYIFQEDGFWFFL